MAARGMALLNRVNIILNKFAPADRTVYKRVITVTGGDQLIGRPGSITYVDTLLTPQPTYQRLGRYGIGPGSHAEMLESSNEKQEGNQYAFLVSPTALTKVDLENEGLQLLLVDGSGHKEVFEIIDYDEPAAMGGVDIIFTLFARSVSRP